MKQEKRLDKLEKGVTENTPYEDIASYKMISVNDDEGTTVNTQGS